MSRRGEPGRAVEWAYAAGWSVVRTMPAGLARATFRFAADHLTRRGGRSVWQLRRNLSRVVPDATGDELDALTREGMRSYARYWLEAFRLPSVPLATMRDTFHMTTPELFEQGAREGCIFALPHSANWEHAGVWVTSQQIPLVSVAERLKPEGLFRRFVAYREALGMEILPTRGGERQPIEVLSERLTDGAVVALLADRDMSARGVPVTFFGHPTRMPPGPALLAIRTGKPLFPVSLWFEPDGTYCKLTGPLPVPEHGTLTERVAELTQRLADELAAGIAAHPADWHMLGRLWLDDRPKTAPAPVPADESAPTG